MDEQLRKKLIDRIRRHSNPLHPDPPGIKPSLQRLDDIRAVVFDVYGTMFISGTGDISLAGEEDSSDAIEEALKAVEFEITDADVAQKVSNKYETAVQTFMERRKKDGIDFPEVNIVAIWREVLEYLVDAHAINGTISEEKVRLFSVEYECRANPIWPMPQLTNLLADIQSMDLDLGIVSNSQFYTPLMFDAMLGKSIQELGFNPALCTWSYEHLIGKPSLMLYEKLIKSMNENVPYGPEQVLYVGNDMLKDVYPAHKLGFKTALFAGDSRSYKSRKDDERCKNLEPDIILSGLHEVLACV